MALNQIQDHHAHQKTVQIDNVKEMFTALTKCTGYNGIFQEEE